jgi:hypothetical protein
MAKHNSYRFGIQFLIVALLLAVSITGCAILGIDADAEVTASWVEPAPMAYGEIVSYTVTNTGTLKLATVSMDFRVLYASGHSYHETWSENDLEPGASVSGTCWVPTNEAGGAISLVECAKVSWTTW